MTDPAAHARLRRIIETERPDLSGGVHHVHSDRMANYLNMVTYRKVMARLRAQFGWPAVDAATFAGVRGAARAGARQVAVDTTTRLDCVRARPTSRVPAPPTCGATASPTSGPIDSAKTSVPMPTVPPSSQPPVSALTSITIRAAPTGAPVTPVQPGHQAVARAGPERGAEVEAAAERDEPDAAEQQHPARDQRVAVDRRSPA